MRGVRGIGRQVFRQALKTSSRMNSTRRVLQAARPLASAVMAFDGVTALSLGGVGVGAGDLESEDADSPEEPR